MAALAYLQLFAIIGFVSLVDTCYYKSYPTNYWCGDGQDAIVYTHGSDPNECKKKCDRTPGCMAAGRSDGQNCWLYSKIGICRRKRQVGRTPHLFFSKWCQKTCTCRNGRPATSGACQRGENCASCNDGFYLKGNKCQTKKCTCKYGVGAIGKACSRNGARHCASCGKKYSLRGKSCVKANPTPISSATPSPTPTGTPSPTLTMTSSATPSPTPTGTSSPTLTMMETPNITSSMTMTMTGTPDPFVCHHPCATDSQIECSTQGPGIQWVCTEEGYTLHLCSLRRAQYMFQNGHMKEYIHTLGMMEAHPVSVGPCVEQERQARAGQAPVRTLAIPGRTVASVNLSRSSIGPVELPFSTVDDPAGLKSLTRIVKLGQADEAVLTASAPEMLDYEEDLHKQLYRVKLKSPVIQIRRYNGEGKPFNSTSVANDTLELYLPVNTTNMDNSTGVLMSFEDGKGNRTFKDVEKLGGSVKFGEEYGGAAKFAVMAAETVHVTISGNIGPASTLFAYKQSCQDGIWNGNEAGLDCGLSCGGLQSFCLHELFKIGAGSAGCVALIAIGIMIIQRGERDEAYSENLVDDTDFLTISNLTHRL